ncbi:hypothetical protein [Bacillus sp. FJAT-29814]|nr:hypothetical protein [Bacillus sp. FJAT-29814]
MLEMVLLVSGTARGQFGDFVHVERTVGGCGLKLGLMRAVPEGGRK